MGFCLRFRSKISENLRRCPSTKPLHPILQDFGPILVDSGSCAEPFHIINYSVCCTSTFLPSECSSNAPGKLLGTFSRVFSHFGDPFRRFLGAQTLPGRSRGALFAKTLSPGSVQGPSRVRLLAFFFSRVRPGLFSGAPGTLSDRFWWISG